MYHVYDTMLGVLDKEIIKTGMFPSFRRVHGLVGKSDIEWKLHNCNEEKCVWEHVAAGTKVVWGSRRYIPQKMFVEKQDNTDNSVSKKAPGVFTEELEKAQCG